MKVSNCCGDFGNKIYSYGKDGYDVITYRDVELCGGCGEHCIYLEEKDFEIIDNKIIEDGINGNTKTEIGRSE